MDTRILSVGIDIGTSTTSMVVSRLTVRNTASCFSVPKVAITDTEILFRGEIYPTPQAEGNRIDADAVAALLEEEYRRAGITPDQVQTGAVIITGESSRKENAALVTQRMSRLAGEFVVATAGPDLESIIAAKGAGAQDYAREHGCTVANLDIGGGTTNLGVFSTGELAGKGCWDIGGRLVRVANGHLTYVSPRLLPVAQSLGITLQVGGPADPALLGQVTDRMAELLAQAAGLLPATDLCAAVRTRESSPLSLEHPPDRICFSGGVADYIYHPSEDWFRHGDIGPLLASSILRHPAFAAAHIIPARETIRATVVGAGSHTTTVSGSTIAYSEEALFPLKNLPILVPSGAAEAQVSQGQSTVLANEARWLLAEGGTENLVFFLGRRPLPDYQQLSALADALTGAADALPAGQPLLVLAEQDYGKALGQALRRRVKGRSVVCLDGIHADQGDYLDLGHPLMEGLVVPIVVKTLIFG